MQYLLKHDVLRLTAVFSLVIMLGCGEQKPNLQYSTIGLAEDHSPLIIAVELTNNGDVDAAVESCSVEVLSTHIFMASGSTGDWPDKFEHHVELRQTAQGPMIASGEAGVIPIAFVWDLPPTAPELLAVCKANFTLEYSSADIETEEVMFVVSSSPEAGARILSEPLTELVNAEAILSDLESFDGKKSANTTRIIELLKGATE